LRELGTALADAQQEYAVALADCARLDSPPPAVRDAAGPRQEPAVAENPAVQPPLTGLDHRASRADAPRGGADGAPAARRDEQRKNVELARQRDELASRLRETEASLSGEQARAEALGSRVEQLEGQLRGLRDRLTQARDAAPEHSRGHLRALQADLESARCSNARAREDMANLLGFLDELSSILAPAAGQGRSNGIRHPSLTSAETPGERPARHLSVEGQQ
jgi:hypothetical protein